MPSDSSYASAVHPDTLVSGKRSIVVEGEKRSMGYVSSEFEYVFDFDSGLPVSVSLVNSPGAISEQLVDVTYSPSDEGPADFTEEALIERWPEEFELYRQDSFRSENLVGKALPSYSCPYLDGQGRAQHIAGEPLQRPAFIVVIDPEVATAQQTIADMRLAADALPQPMGPDHHQAYTAVWGDEALFLPKHTQ